MSTKGMKQPKTKLGGSKEKAKADFDKIDDEDVVNENEMVEHEEEEEVLISFIN